MTRHSDEPSPDQLRLTVDGVDFDIRYDESQPGTYHYTRLTPPAVDYGFTTSRSDHARSSTEQHIGSIRKFLSAVDPVTGYLEDEDELDDDEDDG